MRKKVWSEDDATTHDPDHEHVEKAYKRLVGREFDTRDAIRVNDQGDAIEYEMPEGWFVIMSYPGNSAIERLVAS